MSSRPNLDTTRTYIHRGRGVSIRNVPSYSTYLMNLLALENHVVKERSSRASEKTKQSS